MKTISNIKVNFKRLGYDKKVTVFFEEGKKYSKVVYFHDNQNLWKAENSHTKVSWEIEKLFSKSDLQDILVIGIDNSETNRLDEYGPFQLQEELRQIAPERAIKPQGDDYIEDIIDCLIPVVENNITTSNVKRAIIGSSMGGLISTYAGIKHPEIFNYVGGLSNAYWFCHTDLVKFINKEEKYPERMFLSVGTQESHRGLSNEMYLDSNKLIFDTLYGKTNTIFEMVEKGTHHEIVWQEMLERVVNYLFNQGLENEK
jgi:predicted alpha/beta superfamily hydrolase